MMTKWFALILSSWFFLVEAQVEFIEEDSGVVFEQEAQAKPNKKNRPVKKTPEKKTGIGQEISDKYTPEQPLKTIHPQDMDGQMYYFYLNENIIPLLAINHKWVEYPDKVKHNKRAKKVYSQVTHQADLWQDKEFLIYTALLTIACFSIVGLFLNYVYSASAPKKDLSNPH